LRRPFLSKNNKNFFALILLFSDVLVTAHDEQLGEKRMTMFGSISCGGLAGL
jgi:hypothetical protein